MTGIAAGLGGVLLVLLLHSVQHLAFGYSLELVLGHESFFDGVRAASPMRRVLALVLCGVIAGFGWMGIYRYGKPLVSIARAMRAEKPSMPVVSTVAHAMLQVITIAMGSPLGRELAPREIGATLAIWLSIKSGLSAFETKIMLACGAGAGFAAVYNVPLGGALFVLEVLLRTYRWRAVWPAMLACLIATLVSWACLGNTRQYHFSNITLSDSLIVWSVLTGPVFGFAGYWFNRMTLSARSHAPRGWRLPVLCLLNFGLIGLLAMYFPAVLGNGKAPVQMGLYETLSIGLAAILLVLRVLVTWGSLRAGAQGGLLTPSLANGALLAVLMGGAWCALWPGVEPRAYALIGAVAFLASAQKMPITAIVLIFELTEIRLNLLVPILCCVSGAMAAWYWCKRKG